MANTGGSEGRVLAHHRSAALMWGQGGSSYNDISFGLSDALAHAAQRLDAKADEVILDVGTGTGWSARNVARAGAHVTAVGISSKLLSAAEELSAHVRPRIGFQLADAESLPFPEARFDGVISTFGVIFAQNQKQAARELGGVCRGGGRISLSTWAQGGSAEKYFAVIAKHSDAPAPQTSRLAWGDPKHVEELLGRDFELTFESGVNHAYHPNVDHIWEWYARAFRAAAPAHRRARSGPAQSADEGSRRLSRPLRHAGRAAHQARVPHHPRQAAVAIP